MAYCRYEPQSCGGSTPGASGSCHPQCRTCKAPPPAPSPTVTFVSAPFLPAMLSIIAALEVALSNGPQQCSLEHQPTSPPSTTTRRCMDWPIGDMQRSCAAFRPAAAIDDIRLDHIAARTDIRRCGIDSSTGCPTQLH